MKKITLKIILVKKKPLYSEVVLVCLYRLSDVRENILINDLWSWELPRQLKVCHESMWTRDFASLAYM